MYVGVKHSPESKRLFWFAVPENMAHRVVLGSRILCNTKKGNDESGVVCKVNTQSLDADGVNSLTGNRRIKSITGVEDDIALSTIVIPDKFARTTVREEKLSQRMREFEEYGEFKTKIVVSARDNKLIDGYSAYIAALRMGRNTIRCLIRI